MAERLGASVLARAFPTKCGSQKNVENALSGQNARNFSTVRESCSFAHRKRKNTARTPGKKNAGMSKYPSKNARKTLFRAILKKITSKHAKKCSKDSLWRTLLRNKGATLFSFPGEHTASLLPRNPRNRAFYSTASS